MDQVIQVFASLLVLAAFVAAQRGLLSPSSRPYLALNLAGSSILTAHAAHEGQWGFLLLEASWALVSALALAQSARLARLRR
jgi:hypothetical protein